MLELPQSLFCLPFLYPPKTSTPGRFLCTRRNLPLASERIVKQESRNYSQPKLAPRYLSVEGMFNKLSEASLFFGTSNSEVRKIKKESLPNINVNVEHVARSCTLSTERPYLPTFMFSYLC